MISPLQRLLLAVADVPVVAAAEQPGGPSGVDLLVGGIFATTLRVLMATTFRGFRDRVVRGYDVGWAVGALGAVVIMLTSVRRDDDRPSDG